MSSYSNDCLSKKKYRTRVLDIVKSFPKFDPSKVTPDVDFQKDFGLDNLDLVEIVTAMEEEFSLEIADKEANKFDSSPLASEYLFLTIQLLVRLC